MRFNKRTLALLLGASLSLSMVVQPVLAKKQAAAEAASHSPSKNEGRRLSMTLPGIGTAVVTVTPAQDGPIDPGKMLAPGHHITFGSPIGDEGHKKDLSIATNGRDITVRVPPSVNAVIEDVQVVYKKAGKYATQSLAGLSRFVDLLVLYIRQWSGTTTTITPGGYPYVEKPCLHSFSPAPTTIASGHKLYFTCEGRLKSVVTH